MFGPQLQIMFSKKKDSEEFLDFISKDEEGERIQEQTGIEKSIQVKEKNEVFIK